MSECNKALNVESDGYSYELIERSLHLCVFKEDNVSHINCVYVLFNRCLVFNLQHLKTEDFIVYLIKW